jgi:putative two-component system response regulator
MGMAAAEATSVERVLVVDDDEQVREALSRTMTRAGYACLTAATLEEARATVRRDRPDLVLLDLYLPDGSGIVLARELAARDGAPAVLIITGEDDEAVARIALDAGAYGYLTKPFKRNELTIATESALRRRDAEREHRARRAALEDSVVERTAAAHGAHGRLRLAQEDTVVRLAQAMDLRDPGTGSHITRMSLYCAVLARHFGMDPEAMRVASRLHDIGKIAVSDAVLRKPGPLTPGERAEMMRHAEVGHELLSGSGSELLDLADVIAWTHHERYDGEGYPRGLGGDDIPLPGRIAAVADTFDALTADRVYRAAVGVDEAVALLGAERCRQFDPAVVDAFVASLEDVREIMRSVEATTVPRELAVQAADNAGRLLSLQDAAGVVGVSASTMRRWADDGRVRSIRTAGGHRRFPLDAVHELVAERGPRAMVRPLEPPSGKLEPLATRLKDDGARLVELAATSLYRNSTAGWFANPEAAPGLHAWLAELVRSCETGLPTVAIEATDVLMRRAVLQAATLLERHGFLERFGEAAVRALIRANAPRDQVVGARRLFVALQQALLAGC